MLEHLVVVPRGGLCNRLRAIASAKRLCAGAGARCTVVWDWGDYRALFDDDTEWIPYAAPMDWEGLAILPDYHHIRHRLLPEGGTNRNRRVPVTTHPRVVVISWHVFGAVEEPGLSGYEREVLAWFPKPHASILERVAAFKQARFTPRTVGLHIRRTDNRQAIRRSPDRAYWIEGDRLVDRGHDLFVATDNEETLRMMRRRYGERIIHSQKSNPMARRWPREVMRGEDVAEDLIDLHLLAACAFVVGSAGSTFSRVARLLNGSPRCRILDRPLLRILFWLKILQYRCFPRSVLLSADGSPRA